MKGLYMNYPQWKSWLGTGVLAASLSLFAMPVQAISMNLSPQMGSTENTGSSALLNFKFEQSGANVLMNLNIKNTTSGNLGLGATASTLVGVGFDLPDLIKSYSYNSLTSGFSKLYEQASLAPYGTFDVGIRSAGSGNFSGGNPQSGLTADKETNVQFVFTGNNLVAADVEKSFNQGLQNQSLRVVGRFQQVNAGGGSDKVLGGYVPPMVDEEEHQSVPEPTAIAGLGAVAMGLLVRRRSAKA